LDFLRTFKKLCFKVKIVCFEFFISTHKKISVFKERKTKNIYQGIVFVLQPDTKNRI
jgi:hypothetical protein